MKAIKNLFILVLLCMGSYSYGEYIVESVPVDKVFAPSGYKASDNAELVVKGYLPDLCYKAPKAKVEVLDNKINIKLQSERLVNSGACAEVVIGYVEPVELGVLDKGLYDVYVNGERFSNMYIDESVSDAMEDEIIANIEGIKKDEGSRMIRLQGMNPSDCFVPGEVEIISNGDNAYSILPKMNKISDFCPMKMVPFEIMVEVPDELSEEEVLIHVRSMYGKSLNSLFQN